MAIMAILFLLPAYGSQLEEYNETGTWSSTTTATTNFVAASGNTIQYPLVADLDADGTDEIIMIDGSNVEIYQGSSLTAITSQACHAQPDAVELTDIDGDNKPEIILVGDGIVTRMDFNGTLLNRTLNSSIANQNSEYAIACHTTTCAIFEARYTSPTGNDILNVYRYSSAGVGAATAFDTTTNNGVWIIPFIRNAEVVYDTSDARWEYLVSAYDTGTQDLNVYAGYSNGTHILKEHTYTLADTYADDSFTMPLAYNFLQNEGGSAYEVVIAYQTSADDFTFRMLSNTLTSLDTYGISLLGINDQEGELISNVVRANAFGDTGKTDFCAMGYYAAGDEMNLICVDPIHDTTDGTDVDVAYDLTDQTYTASVPDIRRANTLITAIQVLSTTTNGQNLNEILTPYGIYEINDFDDLDDDLNTLYLFDDPADGAAVFHDVQHVGESDIIYLSADGMYYLDDGFQNDQATIDQYTVNTGNPVCANTTVKITLTVSDVNDDIVTCYINETFVNGTYISQLASQTLDPTASINFYYLADSVGTRLLDLYCTDGEHDVEEWEQYQMDIEAEISGTDNCYNYGENPSTTVISNATTAAEQAANDAFEGSIDTAVEDLGVTSSTAKSWFAIFTVMFLVIASIYGLAQTGVQSGTVYIFVGSTMLIGSSYIFWSLSFLTTFIFGMFTLVAVLGIVLALFTGGMGSGV